MKVEVDMQLAKDAHAELEQHAATRRETRYVADQLHSAIQRAEQRAAKEQARTALDDVADVLMALSGPRDSISLEEATRALREIHDIAAGVLGDDADDELLPEVRAFAVAVNERVKANRHKRHWRDEDVSHLFAGLLDEVYELRSEIARENPDLAAILHKAADVGASAMMVADKMGVLMGDHTQDVRTHKNRGGAK